MAAQPRDRPTSAELGLALTELGERRDPEAKQGASAPATRSAVVSPISTRRLLLTLVGALGMLLAAFTAWAPSQRTSELDRLPSSAVATAPVRAAATYAPKGLVVSPGPAKGELIVSWNMPIRPDVVATVIYEGAGAARARAIVSYNSGPRVPPEATVRGLPSGQEVCLSAAHLVSLDGVTKDAIDDAVCAVPR